MSTSAASRRVATALLFATLAAAYYILNPYWYGDAPWYARHISRGLTLSTLESAHLLWQPLGAAASGLLARVGVPQDPLDVLRALSALFTALLCFATYRLARCLTDSRAVAALATGLVAVSNMCLVYGGSGCSYTAAMALSTLALGAASRRNPEEGNLRPALRAALALGAAWAMWGTCILLLPALCVAALASSPGPWRRRVDAAEKTGLAALAVVLIVGVSAYWLATSGGALSGFVSWVRAGSHGRPPQYNLMNLARAIYGVNVSFLHLGSLGGTLKGGMLGEGLSTSSLTTWISLPAAVAFGLILAASFVALLRASRRSDSPRTRTLTALGVAVLLPVGVFAAGWKGSDIERFSLAVPALACIVCEGVCRHLLPALRNSGARAVAAVALLVGGVAALNFGSWIVPMQLTRGGLTTAIGRQALEHVPRGSALIVAGHAISGDVGTVAAYFDDLNVFNVTSDVGSHGSAQYRERLLRVIDDAIAHGARVAILSDLAGQPTPGGIGFIEREQPDLRMQDLIALFSTWTRHERWTTDRFTFVEITPPEH